MAPDWACMSGRFDFLWTGDLFKSQKEPVARGSASVAIHLLNALIIHNIRSEIRVHRRNHQLHL